MTTKKIPGFCPLNPKLSNDSESDSDSGLNGEGRQKTSTSDYGVLMDSIPLLELLALYTAATMHDYDHPGRTNAFLVATLSPQVSLFSCVFVNCGFTAGSPLFCAFVSQIALYSVSFADLHCIKIQHVCEAISDYFEVFCYPSTLGYIVMQRRKINRGKGF